MDPGFRRGGRGEIGSGAKSFDAFLTQVGIHPGSYRALRWWYYAATLRLWRDLGMDPGFRRGVRGLDGVIAGASSTAPGSRPAGIALQAGAVSDHCEVVALGALVAGVAFHLGFGAQ